MYTARRLLIGFLIVVCLSLRVLAASNTYYVSPAGDDKSDGSSDAPWRSVHVALRSASAGDTVILRAGTYHEALTIDRSGMAGQPSILRSERGEAVTIDGGNLPALSDTSGTSNWVIEELTLRTNGRIAVNLGSWGCDGECRQTTHWTFRNNHIYGEVYIYGGDLLLEGNEVDGSGRELPNGVTELYPASAYNVYRNNYVHDFTVRGFWSMQATHDSLWEGNTVENIGSSCIDLDGFGRLVYRHSLRNNVLSQCDESAIQLENSFDTHIEGNVIAQHDGEGIAILQYGPHNSGKKPLSCGTADGYGDTDGNNDCEGDPSQVPLMDNHITTTGLGAGIGIYQSSDVHIERNVISASFASAINVNIISYRITLVSNTMRGDVSYYDPTAVLYMPDANT